jgi:mannosyltransferase OCH1-like enzyme
MKIPKVIHQTWKTANLPASFKELSDTWKSNHENWSYKLWTDEDNRALIATHYPFFLKQYDAYPLNIQRADAIRYFILHKYGGIYVDLDFECFKNTELLLGDEESVFIQQPQEHCKMFHMTNMVCNAFMASIPGHFFLEEIFNEMSNCRQEFENANEKVLETTGPFMVTRVYERTANQQKIKILDSSTLYTLTSLEIKRYLDSGILNDDQQRKLDQAYGLHYWINTWADCSALPIHPFLNNA